MASELGYKPYDFETTKMNHVLPFILKVGIP